MARFLQQVDYESQIKPEIIRQLTDPTDWFQSAKLVRAEQKAIAQIRNRIGKRYDCDTIFSPAGETDQRDQWVVTITVDITLYHLYSQTGAKDVPEHRSTRYQDAIDWLKDVGNGETTADLPELTDSDTGEAYSEFRLNSRTPENHKW
jgi:hypothetical protein